MTQVEAPQPRDIDVCVVRAGGERFCLETLQVREVLAARTPQHVPLAPALFAGVLAYRGEVLPCISLCVLLDIPSQQQQKAVVVLTDQCTREPFGLMVDAVDDVLHVSQTSFEPNPAALGEQRQRVCAGVYKLADGVMTKLDPLQFGPGKWPELAAITEGN